MSRVGEVVGPVEVGPVAHGGHCVARLDVGDGEDATVRLWRDGGIKVLPGA